MKASWFLSLSSRVVYYWLKGLLRFHRLGLFRPFFFSFSSPMFPLPQCILHTPSVQANRGNPKLTNRIIFQHAQRPVHAWAPQRAVEARRSHGDQAHGDCAGFCWGMLVSEISKGTGRRGEAYVFSAWGLVSWIGYGVGDWRLEVSRWEGRGRC